MKNKRLFIELFILRITAINPPKTKSISLTKYATLPTCTLEPLAALLEYHFSLNIDFHLILTLFEILLTSSKFNDIMDCIVILPCP